MEGIIWGPLGSWTLSGMSQCHLPRTFSHSWREIELWTSVPVLGGEGDEVPQVTAGSCQPQLVPCPQLLPQGRDLSQALSPGNVPRCARGNNTITRECVVWKLKIIRSGPCECFFSMLEPHLNYPKRCVHTSHHGFVDIKGVCTHPTTLLLI